MASMVGNPTGSVGEGRLSSPEYVRNTGVGRTGGSAAPRGLAGGAQRAAQENVRAKEQAVGTRQREGQRTANANRLQKEAGVREKAIAKASVYRGGGKGMEGRRFGPAPGKRAGGGLVEKAQGYR